LPRPGIEGMFLLNGRRLRRRRNTQVALGLRCKEVALCRDNCNISSLIQFRCQSMHDIVFQCTVPGILENKISPQECRLN
jgi:hypothetical protein